MGRDDRNDHMIKARQVIADPPKRHTPKLSPAPLHMARDGYETLAHAGATEALFHDNERAVTYNEGEDDICAYYYPIR